MEAWRRSAHGASARTAKDAGLWHPLAPDRSARAFCPLIVGPGAAGGRLFIRSSSLADGRETLAKASVALTYRDAFRGKYKGTSPPHCCLDVIDRDHGQRTAARSEWLGTFEHRLSCLNEEGRIIQDPVAYEAASMMDVEFLDYHPMWQSSTAEVVSRRPVAGLHLHYLCIGLILRLILPD